MTVKANTKIVKSARIVNCTCTCQESPEATGWKAAGSIAGGAAAVAGGVALTVMTGGLAAVFGGAALVGAGSSMVINPIAKKAAGERMTGGDYVTDVAVGTVIGAASGGIGAGGSVLDIWPAMFQKRLAMKLVGPPSESELKRLPGQESTPVFNTMKPVKSM